MSRTAWMSLPAGTAASTAFRKRRNSWWRWRCMQRPITRPSSTFRAAKRVVVPPDQVRGRLFHFTPTSASWLNAVEGFFAKLTKRRLKRGVFGSVVELQAAINRYLAETNDHPRPFQWTKDPDKIIAAVRRGHQALDAIH